MEPIAGAPNYITVPVWLKTESDIKNGSILPVVWAAKGLHVDLARRQAYYKVFNTQ